MFLQLFLRLLVLGYLSFELFICCPELSSLLPESSPGTLAFGDLASEFLTGGTRDSQRLFGNLLLEVLLDLLTLADFVSQSFVGCCQFGTLLL